MNSVYDSETNRSKREMFQTKGLESWRGVSKKRNIVDVATKSFTLYVLEVPRILGYYQSPLDVPVCKKVLL